MDGAKEVEKKTSLNVKFFDWDYLHLTTLMKETYFKNSNWTSMQYHIESQHYSPGYSCPRCYRSFKLYSSFRRHLKRKMPCVQSQIINSSV